MEDKRTAVERTVVRGFEGHRLERPLLALVYEHLWPVVRGRVAVRPSVEAVRPVAQELQQALGG